MGALHNGHLSLVAASQQQCDLTVVSIFVNPTQFNEAADLDSYPRTPGRDARLLAGAGVEVLFLPSVAAIYPEGLAPEPNVDFGPLATVMEGARRPGHFAGVAQVIDRLLDVVQPRALFMGQKDYQQAAIVRELLRQTRRDVALVTCPIVREADGLAMSSRNQRLTAPMRAAAPAIQRQLQYVVRHLGEAPLPTLLHIGQQNLRAAGLRPEYLTAAHPDTLQPVTTFDAETGLVVCAAAWAGDVRLIDNTWVRGTSTT